MSTPLSDSPIEPPPDSDPGLSPPHARFSLPTDSRTAALKVPPHSVEAEQAVLGGLMLDNQAWDRVADLVSAEDFYRREHKLLFAAVASLAEVSQPFDVVTLSERLASLGQLHDAGDLAYLSEITRTTPSAANIAAYAQIVRERSVLRSLISVGGSIADAAFRPDGREAKDLLELAESEVFAIAERGARNRGGFTPIGKVLEEVMVRVAELVENPSSVTGVATGFTELDEKTSGLQPADLIIVAGRPSMGKTAFAMNLVEQAAISGNVAVGVFSLEMPAPQLAMRMLSSLGRVDQHKVRTGRLADDDWPRISSALSMLNDTKIFIDDTAGLSPTELRARCRRLSREHPLGLIVIDYLQLMSVHGSSENRATEISEISRSLKALAKEINVPVVALSQLNRSLEQRNDKRPVMSDLRESGAIEQDADVILFIYRDEVYNENSEHKGTAEIIIGKQRNGPIGKVTLTFLGQHTRFENFAASPYLPPGYGTPSASAGPAQRPAPGEDPGIDEGYGSFGGGYPDEYES